MSVAAAPRPWASTIAARADSGGVPAIRTGCPPWGGGTSCRSSIMASIGRPQSARQARRGRRSQGWQHALDVAAEVLQERGQDEALAQVSPVLVDRETGTVGRQLEKHAAGLEEVDRLEPEAVDDLRRR